MLNTTLRNGLMLLVWLCLIFSVRAEEVPFLAPQQRDEVMYKPAAALEAALEDSWNGPIWQSLKTPWLDGLDK